MHRVTHVLLCLTLYLIGFGESTLLAEETTRQSKGLEPFFHATIDFYDKLLRTNHGLYLDNYLLDVKREDQSTTCSTAAIGVGMVALCVNHELDRDPEAQQKALQTLRAINGKISGFQIERDPSGYFRHFFSSQDGSGNSENSTMDTALMVVGALFCRNTFDDRRDPGRS